MNILTKLPKAKPLSNYPSVAIRQAVEDIEAIEKTPGFGVNMSRWLNWNNFSKNQVCQVCQAGAIAIRRYPTPRHRKSDRGSLSVGSKYRDQASKKLEFCQVRSFDCLRNGDFGSFLEEWIAKRDDVVLVCDILCSRFPADKWVRYDQSPAKYKRNMLLVADLIEAEGY